MRRLAAALWLLAAACSVPLEGAPCTDSTDCPGGQACGYDHTCTEAAAACAAMMECREGDASCPSQSVATVCAAQGVCGVWQTTNCTAAQICGPTGCQARYTLQITSPGAGVTTGRSGVQVEVSLTPGPTVSPPAQVTLVAQSASTSPTSSLSRTTPPGATPALYAGTYTPLDNLEEPVTLRTFAAYGLPDETGSNQVVVAVDTLAPRITGVTMTCVTCRRDDVLTVRATVADGHPGTVSATIHFPPSWSQPVTLTPPASGSDWQGTLALASQSFPFFQAVGHASVTATDSLGNQATAVSSDVTVTRLRFTVPVETSAPPAITGPAVNTSNRLLYHGGANGSVYVVDPVAGTVIAAWPVAADAIVAPPSLGGAALWVGGQDGVIHALDPASGNSLGTCATLGQVVASPAVDTASPETAYVGAVIAASSGRIFAVRASAGCVASTNLYTSQRVASSPAIDAMKRVYAVTGTNLRSLTLVEPPPAFSENWSALVGPTGSVEAPVGFDPGRSPGYVWTADTGGSIAATSVGGTGLGGSPFTTAAGPGAPVIDAAGNVVVGDAAGYVHKVVPGGTGWTTSTALGGAAGSPLVLAGGDAAYLVPTSTGRLAALRDDGTILWSGQVATTGTSLHDPNVVRLTGDAFWTAVFGAQDGTVYGVLVDGQMDTAAPWPKARHDSRNTGNVVTPLP